MPRSLKVRGDCIEKVKLAVRRNGFASQKFLAEEVGLALATVSNFLTGKPVDHATFEELCRRLALDWREIADLDFEASSVAIGQNAERKTTSKHQDLGKAIDVSVFYERTNIPRSRTIKFVGRSQALERLNAILHANDIAAIMGMGGVGKTELAIQYSSYHLSQNSYPGGICWLQGRNENVGFQVVQFAKIKLGLQPPENFELSQQVEFCWQHWHKGNVLVVLDDVNNYQDVELYLPPLQSQFKVLITTRLQFDIPSLCLNVLDESVTLDLLAQWVGIEKISQSLTDAKEICQRLGYLPLAMNLGGRYIKKRKLTLADMLWRLDNKGLDILNLDEHDRTLTLKIERGVAATFELSWEELSEQAKRFGCLLSLFALAPIPWSLVESVDKTQNSEDMENAKIELEDLHLLSANKTQNYQFPGIDRVDSLEDLDLVQGKETYQLHQLIREFFQKKLNQSSWKEELNQGFCQLIVEKVKKLAHEYETVREEMYPGEQRTFKMSKIIDRARSLGRTIEYNTYDYKTIFKGTSGERVVILGLLQGQQVSDPDVFELVLQGISDSRSAFEQSHALLLAYNFGTSLSKHQKQRLKKTIINQYSKHIKKGTDRWYLSQEIFELFGLDEYGNS